MSLKEFQPICKLGIYWGKGGASIIFLGEGAYSSVYKVKRIKDSEEYALKKVKLQNLTEKEKENALNEVRILASVKHKNIIRYMEAFIDNNSNCLW